MKHNLVLTSVICLAASAPLGWTAAFNSGSDGSYGALEVTASTVLDLPPDGVFRCTTVRVAPGAILSFRPNALNTPAVILATGDVTIEGTISVNGENGALGFAGRGGPGGFEGGAPAVSGQPPGDGYGPGRGKAGAAGLAQADGVGAADYAGGSYYNNSSFPQHGRTYGHRLLIPLVGGSGGGGTEGAPGYGGGGGGGAILIASSTRIQVASGAYVQANGGSWPFGSGGAIRLVAPEVTLAGFLQAVSMQYSGFYGGNGRIRIDCQNRTGISQQNIAGVYSIGSLMMVAPPATPRLDILSVAGQAIPEGASEEVQFALPVGAPASQVVTLQGRDFKGVVPVELVLTPENGPSQTYPLTLDMTSANPAQASVTVSLPANNLTRIHAWTR